MKYFFKTTIQLITAEKHCSLLFFRVRLDGYPRDYTLLTIHFSVSIKIKKVEGITFQKQTKL